MSSDTKRLLKQLDKKELYEIAKLKRINIPKDWSTTPIVELLALNVSKKDIQTVVTKPPPHEGEDKNKGWFCNYHKGSCKAI